jgi:hypothetical protein
MVASDLWVGLNLIGMIPRNGDASSRCCFRRFCAHAAISMRRVIRGEITMPAAQTRVVNDPWRATKRLLVFARFCSLSKTAQREVFRYVSIETSEVPELRLLRDSFATRTKVFREANDEQFGYVKERPMTLSCSVLRRWIALAVFCMTLGWSATSLGQSQEVLRNADIVKMTTAGLGADTIVLKIETSTTQFDTSTDALAVLKAAGVPDVAIVAMIKAGARTTNSPASPNTPPPSPAPVPVTSQDDSKATVYVYRPGKFMGKALEPSVFLDDKKLLDMDNARYFALKLDPGRHILRSNEKDSEIVFNGL